VRAVRGQLRSREYELLGMRFWRSRAVLIISLAAILSAVACGQDAPTHALTVRAVVGTDRSVCRDPAGRDLEGTAFTVTDASGEVLHEGQLGPATLDGVLGKSVCSFYGEASVPDSTSYSVRVDDGENVTYSKSDAVEARWVILVPEESI
jgi:hypothetical protein